MVFSGSYKYSVDSKNRISIPVKFRILLGERPILTKGPDGCLWLFSEEQWNLIIAKASESTTLQRFFLASAVECEFGTRGRCLLPDDLRRYAEIKPGDEVVLAGMINRVEIWSASRWAVACPQLTSEKIRDELPEFYNMMYK